MSLKIPYRIQTIIDLIPDQKYEHVYDLCCDHGQIGIAAYKQRNISKIIFVDQIKSITEKLNKTITTDIPSFGNYKILTISILNEELYIHKESLVILVGIGGNLIVEFLKKQKPQCEMILCAHQNHHELRAYLNQNDWEINEEKLIQEGNQFYDFLRIKPGKRGSMAKYFTAWESENAEHLNYLLKELAYLKIKSTKGKCVDSQFLYEEFTQILLKNFKRKL